jgi:hypothetical protein
MISSPKIEKYLTTIKKENWTPEELRELLQAIAGDFQINIRIVDEKDEDDFWKLSPEEEQHFNDLLDRSTKDLNNKNYSEYKRPQA